MGGRFQQPVAPCSQPLFYNSGGKDRAIVPVEEPIAGDRGEGYSWVTPRQAGSKLNF